MAQHNVSRSPVDSWNTWDDQKFGIETKIAEYRSQLSTHPTPSSPVENEPDLFSDLQPTLKAAKTVCFDC
jgi:hypothetical protein